MNWIERQRFRLASWLAPRPSASVYDAAGQGRRFKGRSVQRIAANSAIFQDGALLRTRARDLVRQNAWASKALASYVANAIGTGIKPRSKHPDPKMRDLLNRKFAAWTDEADAAGRTDWYGLQALALRSMMEAGECLGRFRVRFNSDGLTVPLQIQLLESEFLPLDGFQAMQADGQNVIRMGIEYDAIGRRVAYHLHPKHPDDTSLGGGSILTTRVPASEIMHLFQQLNPGQERGVTAFAQAIIRLSSLEKYDDAELLRKQMSACFALFLRENDPDDPMLKSGTEAGDDDDEYKLEAGTITRLHPGEDIIQTNPTDVGPNYEMFIRSQLRAIAAGLGITYEMLSGDLSGVSYSSIRHGLLEFRRVCEQLQWHVMVFQFCRPTWKAWLQQAALAGAIPADQYRRNRADFEAVEWCTPRWSWVDPLKDIQAEVKAIRAGLTSRAASVAERGFDAEEIDAQNAMDQQRADKLGLAYDTDGRRDTKGQPAGLSDGTNDTAPQGQELIQ